MWLTNFIRKYLPRIAQTFIAEGIERERTRIQKDRENDAVFVADGLQKSFVIGICPNCIIVGRIIRWLENGSNQTSTIPIIQDIQSGKEVICFGVLKPYHPTLLKLILDMGDAHKAYCMVSTWPNWKPQVNDDEVLEEHIKEIFAQYPLSKIQYQEENT